MAKKRKLAAILFADIRGYTSLMQTDEASARGFLERFRNSMNTIVPKNQGKVINFYGDGCLCIFDSAVDCAHGAIELQEGFIQGESVPVRLGMHVGDVFFESNDVFGDSVNIASRIESMGVPGSILLSKKVQDELRNHPDIITKSLGKFDFKNVVEPIEVFAIDRKGFVVPSLSDMKGKGQSNINSLNLAWIAVSLLALSIIGWTINEFLIEGEDLEDTSAISVVPPQMAEKSLAVIPFSFISNEKDQEYFADGMMDEIINKLFQVEGLRVVSRTTSMKYKDSQLSSKEIANELNVANILEGTVRTYKGQAQVTMRLIDGITDERKWQSDYQGDLENIFEIQSNIAQDIAKGLDVQINSEVKARMAESTTDNIEVWKLYRRARNAFDNDDNASALGLLTEALTLDSTFAPAHAELGFSEILRGSFLGDALPADFLGKGMKHLDKAVELSPNFPKTYVYLALVELWFNWDFVKAKQHWDTFYRLGPSNPKDPGYIDFLIATERFEEAELVSEKMKKDNPYEMSNWTTSGLSYFFNGKPKKAVEHYEIAMSKFTSLSIQSEASRAFVYAEEYELVMDRFSPLLDRIESHTPRTAALLAITLHHSGDEELVQRYLEVLKNKSELSPIGSPSFYTAMILSQMNRKDEAFLYLQKAFETHEVEMFWIKVEPPFRPLHNDERWDQLITKMNYPKKEEL